jgi:hypothetical protein
MTDEKIKPVATVGNLDQYGNETIDWEAGELPYGTNLYPESALAQAEEKGRLKGLREASKDAERYRLLKKIATDIKWKGNHVVGMTMNCLDNSLDIALDALNKEQQ